MTSPRELPGDPAGSQRCITCGDSGEPMVVLAVDGPRRLALCLDDAGRRMTVETELVDPVEPGDRLLVHAAVALAVLT